MGSRIFGSESEEKDTESGRVREGTQAADSDELEFVNAQEKTEDDDLDTGELILRAEAASEKTDAAIEKAEETARLLEEAVKRRSAQREAEMSPSCEECRSFQDVKEAGVSEAEGETHRAKRIKNQIPARKSVNRSFIESLAGSNKNGAPCGNPSQSCLPESTAWSTNANPSLHL